MIKFTQGKKIAVSALAMFALSFSAMMFFLGGGSVEIDHVQTNVLQAESAAEEVEADYSQYVVGEETPYFVTDFEGVFIYANHDFCRFVGKKCSDLFGHKFVDYINSKDHSGVLSIYTKLIQNGEKVEGIGPFRMLHGDSESLVLLTAQPILEGEKVVKIVFTMRDLTNQVEDLKDGKKDEGSDWIDRLYPKIREMGDGDASRLMVEKISFAKD